MPSTRRGRPAGSTSTPKSTAQKTLAFGPNSSNKITKPSPLSQSHSKKLSPTQKSALSAAASEAEISAPGSPAEDADAQEESKALPIRQEQRAEKKNEAARDKRDLEAQKVSEAQIKKYWKLKEEARISPRVHQQGLSVREKVLREFDLSSQFGPCIGIPRMKRWKRADGLGLRPPLEVLAVLLKEEEGGQKGAERAYVDTLLGHQLGGIES